jgi:hypothetical protein
VVLRVASGSFGIWLRGSSIGDTFRFGKVGYFMKFTVTSVYKYCQPLQ